MQWRYILQKTEWNIFQAGDAMKNGYLKDYFKGIAVKKLSAVEVDTLKSNQHEYNGDKALRGLFGIDSGKKYLKTKFLFLNDDEVISADGIMTWYDARANHPTRTEWRLYFPTTDVSYRASVRDTLFICSRPNGDVLVVIASNESTIENQLYWLFDIKEDNASKFQLKNEFASNKDQFEFVSRIILEQIGVELKDDNDEYLGEMLELFDGKFPSTKVFSEYARSTVNNTSAIEDPDEALIRWVDREESLFRSLEKHIISKRLQDGFANENEVDVEGFVQFSLSVQNRRKSRVGQALENHMEEILIERNNMYSRTPVTENKSKPDFVFPCIEAYRNIRYPAAYLTMLGAKSTCKDRWRQVLAEADRIDKKHLLTLEAAISENQTNEMQAKNLQLVLPKSLHSTYSIKQQDWLYTIDNFLIEIEEKQNYYQKCKK